MALWSRPITQCWTDPGWFRWKVHRKRPLIDYLWEWSSNFHKRLGRLLFIFPLPLLFPCCCNICLPFPAYPQHILPCEPATLQCHIFRLQFFPPYPPANHSNRWFGKQDNRSIGGYLMQQQLNLLTRSTERPVGWSAAEYSAKSAAWFKISAAIREGRGKLPIEATALLLFRR